MQHNPFDKQNIHASRFIIGCRSNDPELSQKVLNSTPDIILLLTNAEEDRLNPLNALLDRLHENKQNPDGKSVFNNYNATGQKKLFADNANLFINRPCDETDPFIPVLDDYLKKVRNANGCREHCVEHLDNSLRYIHENRLSVEDEKDTIENTRLTLLNSIFYAQQAMEEKKVKDLINSGEYICIPDQYAHLLSPEKQILRQDALCGGNHLEL